MKGLLMKYFVLKPKGKLTDPYAHASRQAMETYAYCIRKENPKLRNGLMEWVRNEEIEAKNDSPRTS